MNIRTGINKETVITLTKRERDMLYAAQQIVSQLARVADIGSNLSVLSAGCGEALKNLAKELDQ